MGRFLTYILAAAGAVLLTPCPARAALTPQQVVVVYNGDSERSTAAARLYAKVRSVPEEQLVALHGLKAETAAITRKDYDTKVAEPLVNAAREHGWSWPAAEGNGKRMAAMVLMPDLPLKIKERVNRPVPKHPDGRPDFRVRPPHDAAALDSELALLGGVYSLEGAINNPCFKAATPAELNKQRVLAVCRIDGADDATVTRMIQDPAAVEKTGLRGWVVVDEGGPYPQGDAQFTAAAELARKAGQPLFYENSKEMLAPCFPLMPQTAVYFGWYTDKANGPFSPSAPDTFRFAAGAVAVHLHSFSCPALRDTRRWVPALLARGAAVSAGNVDEPLLSGCLDLGVFYDRLLKGCSVAEAGLMATPQLSWQSVILGDPLYRPFAAAKGGAAAKNPFSAWAGLQKQYGGNVPDSAVKSRMKGSNTALFAEMAGWAAADRNQLPAAADWFEQAAKASATPQDRLRNMLMQATVLHLAKETRRASALMHHCLEDYENTPYYPAVEKTATTVLKAEGWKPKPKPKPAKPAAKQEAKPKA